MIDKNRSASSNRWLQKYLNDKYVQQAQKKGLRSRSWFKLAEIQKSNKIFKPGMTVVDLGSAPGGWSQYGITEIGNNGHIIACDLLPMEDIVGVNFLQGDFRKESVRKKIFEQVVNQKKVQVVMSDMAPNMCGIPEIDIPRALYLVELALKMSLEILSPNGTFIVKMFQGKGFEDSLKEISCLFTKVKIKKPDASRVRSREVYIVATGRK